MRIGNGECGDCGQVHPIGEDCRARTAPREETTWCVDCGGRYTDEEIEGKSACPGCGNSGVPCSAKNDIRVEVNWHELRILSIWAEFWAQHHTDENPKMTRTVQAIARRLQQQHPTLTPLTLSQEIAELPADMAKAGVVIGKVETHNIGKPRPLPVNGPGAVGHSKSQ